MDELTGLTEQSGHEDLCLPDHSKIDCPSLEGREILCVDCILYRRGNVHTKFKKLIPILLID